ncbi:MAG: hypothetical protein ABSF38_16805, partial [Verrucomicrobiota bacterium]
MMNETLAQQLKYLRLPGLLSRWDEHLNAAAQSNLSHARFLKRTRVRLRCGLGRWQNQPAYSVDLRDNPAWGSGRNLSGAVVQVLAYQLRPLTGSGWLVLDGI